jgi:hypothetical protein
VARAIRGRHTNLRSEGWARPGTHEDNIDRSAAAGIASDCATWRYCPAATVTRGQMASFLRRIEQPVTSPPHPARTPTPKPACVPSYPTVSLPFAPPDLNCPDIPWTDFKVFYNVAEPDPHDLDGNKNGIACET